MAYTLYRTAHSTFVKETEDFTVQILDAAGRTAAVPMDLGATWYPGLDYGRAIPMIPHYEPGDIALTNDPYSGFLATHTPDLRCGSRSSTRASCCASPPATSTTPTWAAPCRPASRAP